MFNMSTAASNNTITILYPGNATGGLSSGTSIGIDPAYYQNPGTFTTTTTGNFTFPQEKTAILTKTQLDLMLEKVKECILTKEHFKSALEFALHEKIIDSLDYLYYLNLID